MPGKREAKKEDLRARLVESARALIHEQGLTNLRARDIAARAGCALGALYTVFADIDELILKVNSQTLHGMQQALSQEASRLDEGWHIFRKLSLAYLSYARDNQNLWSALFEHRMPDSTPVPDWHLGEHEFLIGFIAQPLADAMPEASVADISVRARTFFAAIHGVIALSLENRFIGLANEKLEAEVAMLADLLAQGATSFRQTTQT